MKRILKRILRHEGGASIIEFALLAPVFIALLMGVVTVGLYMQNYNAVRSLATDAARFAAVEYQKNNDISEEALADNIRLMGTRSPYNLVGSRLEIAIEEGATGIAGARRFDLSLSYDLPDIIGGISIDNVTLTYSRQIFVLA